MLSFVYLCHNYVSDWPEKTPEATSVWSLDKQLQEIILHGSGKIPKPRVRVKRPNRDETEEREAFLKLGEYSYFLC